MLKLNLGPIFKARGIQSGFSFLRDAGMSAHTAHTMQTGKTKSIHLDQIELLCTVLVCEPTDLFKWEPDSDVQFPETHPLRDLRETEPVKNMKDTFANTPYKKLKEMAKKLEE